MCDKPKPGTLGYAMMMVRQLERECDYLAKQCVEGVGYCPVHVYDLADTLPAWCSFNRQEDGSFTCKESEPYKCWRKYVKGLGV